MRHEIRVSCQRASKGTFDTSNSAPWERIVVRSYLSAFFIFVTCSAPGHGMAPAYGQNAGAKTFSTEQLDQMLAPIALYPDELLANVLMASTYPLDVVRSRAVA